MVVFPDSISFFSDAEELIVAKKIENERRTSLQCITAHLGQDSSKISFCGPHLFMCSLSV